MQELKLRLMTLTRGLAPVMLAASLCALGAACDDNSTSTADTVADVPADTAADSTPADTGSPTDTTNPDGRVGPPVCPADCSDGNPCTVDSCNEALGICENKTQADDSPCGCDQAGKCFSGNCVGNSQVCGSNLDCDDQRTCTINRCDGGCRCVTEVQDDCIEVDP